MGGKKITVDEFWSRVEKRGDCWEWTMSRNTRNYGILGYRRQSWLAHRLAYVFAYGDFPRELDVLHRCDNPPCINPDHLWLGTAKDNTRDMIAKGRARHAKGDATGARKHPELMPRGERSGPAKLKEADVRELRQLYASGDYGLTTLARKYGVTPHAIALVVKRLSWRHVA